MLSSMQKKLDNLCEQLNYVKDQPEIETKSVESGCKLCHHNLPQNGSLVNLYIHVFFSCILLCDIS